jgi:hypothetical protein
VADIAFSVNAGSFAISLIDSVSGSDYVSDIAYGDKPMSVWKQNPDLMERLVAAQNRLTRPIDIVTFAAFCDTREELEAHVVRYEQEAA